MKTTTKRYSADFKAKVTLEAIRGDLTLAKLGAKHGIHHTMIAAWKRQAVDGNVFIERLWRSLKYECVYLHAFETGSELRVGLTRWISYYNADRPHSGLAGRTPNEAYGANEMRSIAGLAPPSETLLLAA